jgi:hypothetical protein
MTLEYIVANQVWVFVFGNSTVPVDGIRYFESRANAVHHARQVGLKVSSSSKVQKQASS